MEVRCLIFCLPRDRKCWPYNSGPGEIDPSQMDTSVVTMTDAETGEEIELVIDALLLGRYKKMFGHWHFISVSNGDDIGHFFTRTLRAKGVLS